MVMLKPMNCAPARRPRSPTSDGGHETPVDLLNEILEAGLGGGEAVIEARSEVVKAGHVLLEEIDALVDSVAAISEIGMSFSSSPHAY